MTLLLASLVLAAAPVQSYTIMAPESGSMVRSLTSAETCPTARIDGRRVAMATRAAPRDYAPRANAAGEAQTVSFAQRVCEVAVPRAARHVSVAGRSVPVAPRLVRRIVLLGDTGCRLKTASNAFQACNDATKWPFARVARAAAARHPDLVLHVGDYLYRENPCPEGNEGCKGAVWGYGGASWQADFLKPAAPLLAAAPWVVVRGNHEECRRAGQGWWLMLDPHALREGADCASAAQDFEGNHTAPYSVSLGGHARLIVADFAAIGEKPLADEALARYRADAASIQAQARAGDVNFVTSHYPFAAVTNSAKKGQHIGYDSVSGAFDAPARVPELPHVAAMLAGHVHMLQYVQPKHAPAQIITGFSGTEEETPLAPTRLSQLDGLPDGVAVTDLAGRVEQFGYGLLERGRGGVWRFTAYAIDGRRLLTRQIARR